MKHSFIFDILKSTFIRVLFIIQAVICLLECVVTAVISLGAGDVIVSMTNFTVSVVLSVVSLRMIILCATNRRLTAHRFSQLVNYYGLILMRQVFSSNTEIPAEIAAKVVLCTAYVFMLISFWKPDAVKKVNFVGVLILFFIAVAGTCGIAGYQTYEFFLRSISQMPEITDGLSEVMLKISAVVAALFGVFWDCLKFILPSAILIWIGKHKDDEDKSLEIII